MSGRIYCSVHVLMLERSHPSSAITWSYLESWVQLRCAVQGIRVSFVQSIWNLAFPDAICVFLSTWASFPPPSANAVHSCGSVGSTAGLVFPQPNVGLTFSIEEGLEQEWVRQMVCVIWIWVLVSMHILGGMGRRKTSDLKTFHTKVILRITRFF